MLQLSSPFEPCLSQLGGANVVSTLGRLIIDPGSDSDRIWAIVESLDNVIDSSVFALDEDSLVEAIQQWLSDHK